MKKILRNQYGMTLIEITAALLIFAMFCLMVSTALVPVLKQFVHSNELSELSLLVDNVGDEISNNITTAKAVKNNIGDDGGIICEMDGYTITYKMKDDTLQSSFNKTDFFPVYDVKYYKQKKLTMEKIATETSMVNDKGIVKMRLTIKDSTGRIMIERNVSARPMILSN